MLAKIMHNNSVYYSPVFAVSIKRNNCKAVVFDSSFSQLIVLHIFQGTRYNILFAQYVMGLCIVVALWTSLGTAFLSFIAGFQTVDRSMYEAAAVDGIKNRWQELWYITLPTMRPQMMFGAVLAITNSFGFGGVVTALCGFPSVDYAAHTIMHHLDDYGGSRYEIGYASAIAVVLFIMMFASNILVKKALSKVGE